LGAGVSGFSPAIKVDELHFLHMREERFAGITVRLTGGEDREGGGDGPLVVLMHGFGAPGTDLVDLWRVLNVPSSTRFAFPEAPHEIPGMFGARAWWMLDLARVADSTFKRLVSSRRK
jgi:phospholipase/carboxylesterase